MAMLADATARGELVAFIDTLDRSIRHRPTRRACGWITCSGSAATAATHSCRSRDVGTVAARRPPRDADAARGRPR
jgi:hypothetical protein